jgi:hypothetical protein
MLINPYGNYVIQKALAEAYEPELGLMLKVTRSTMAIEGQD